MCCDCRSLQVRYSLRPFISLASSPGPSPDLSMLHVRRRAWGRGYHSQLQGSWSSSLTCGHYFRHSLKFLPTRAHAVLLEQEHCVRTDDRTTVTGHTMHMKEQLHNPAHNSTDEFISHCYIVDVCFFVVAKSSCYLSPGATLYLKRIIHVQQ